MIFINILYKKFNFLIILKNHMSPAQFYAECNLNPSGVLNQITYVKMDGDIFFRDLVILT